jgi:hypothetical protein
MSYSHGSARANILAPKVEVYNGKISYSISEVIY